MGFIAENNSIFTKAAQIATENCLNESGDGSVLSSEKWGKNVNTVADMLEMLMHFKQVSKNPAMFVFISPEKQLFEMLACDVVGEKLVFQLKQISGSPSPIPVGYIIAGIEHEMTGHDKTSVTCQFECNDKILDAISFELKTIRFNDDPTVIYVVECQVTESNTERTVSVKSIESSIIPHTTDGLSSALSEVITKSKRQNLHKTAVIFEIPSVRDYRFGDELPEGVPDEIAQSLGTLCVVDTIRKGGERHVKLDLMSFDRVKESAQILNDAEFSADELMKKLNQFQKGLELFFMYKGEPYEIDSLTANAGQPIQCVLVPWGTLDESKHSHYPEIKTWAKQCDGNIIAF